MVRGSGEVPKTSMGGRNRGAREQDVLRGAERTIWPISTDQVCDVAGGSFVDGFVCCG